MLNHKHKQSYSIQWLEVNIYNTCKHVRNSIQIYKEVLQHNIATERFKKEISRKHWTGWANQ